MPHVVACPNCKKKLAVKDELKGRALICPKCKGRFTVPTDEGAADDPLGLESGTTPAAEDGGVGFLDNLGPASAPAAKSASKPAAATTRSPAGKSPSTAASIGLSRAAASRAKKQAEQMKMIYIGGGIGAAVLLVIIVAVAMNSGGGGTGGGDGKPKEQIIRFGLQDATRHKLFEDMITAVDEYGITAACKREWFRLADECNPPLDHSHLKDILDEGFDRKDWDQPAPASITNKNRATRMEWNAARLHGPDPVLAL